MQRSFLNFLSGLLESLDPDYIPVVGARAVFTNPLDHLLVCNRELFARIQQRCHDSSLGVGVYDCLCPCVLAKGRQIGIFERTCRQDKASNRPQTVTDRRTLCFEMIFYVSRRVINGFGFYDL